MDPSERGDVIIGGLLRLVAGLGVLIVVLFDVGALAVNRVQLDAAAGSAARAGVAERADGRAAVEQAVAQRLSRVKDVVVDELVIDHSGVTVTITRPAPVLVVDRLGRLGALATPSVTKRAAFP